MRCFNDVRQCRKNGSRQNQISAILFTAYSVCRYCDSYLGESTSTFMYACNFDHRQLGLVWRLRSEADVWCQLWINLGLYGRHMVQESLKYSISSFHNIFWSCTEFIGEVLRPQYHKAAHIHTITEHSIHLSGLKFVVDLYVHVCMQPCVCVCGWYYAFFAWRENR